MKKVKQTMNIQIKIKKWKKESQERRKRDKINHTKIHNDINFKLKGILISGIKCGDKSNLCRGKYLKQKI